MGLLDDAIREHLDLKRRRGGDPEEIERAEQEALGPVRRGPEAPEYVDPDAEGDLLFEDEEQWEEPFDQEEELPSSHHPGRRFEDEEEPPGAERAPEAHESEPFLDEGPPGSTPARARRPPDHAGEETAEYEVEGALDAERGKHREDVLEETPEFLQDTPDHDRLWFEQRPPRDFDFDG